MPSSSPTIFPPRDKHDFPSLDLISASPPQTWIHLIPELLTWLQDRNWPISSRVNEVLLLNPTALVEPIRLVFKGNDEAWQSNCLELVRRMPRETRVQLKEDLETFAAGTSDETDREWDMRKDVDEVLESTAV